MTTGTTVAAFDVETGQRIIKVVRQVEAAGVPSPPSLSRQAYSVKQIIVPRSGPDGGLYTCDIYIVNDGTAGTYTRVATGQKMRLLPDTIAP